MRAATVALIVHGREGTPQLIDVLSDEREIAEIEIAIAQGDQDPLKRVKEHRLQKQAEDSEFGDYVEELLSHPFQKPEVRDHGIQWLKSKLRIEEFQKSETEAARIIARFALDVFLQDPDKVDFFLAGPTAQVRVRVFLLPPKSLRSDAA